MELEDYFKTPSQEEIDRQWPTQLCYDGQMADNEIEEHVNTVIEWNEKRVKNNVDLYNVSQQRELLKAYEQANNPCDCDSCKETASDRIEKYLSL